MHDNTIQQTAIGLWVGVPTGSYTRYTDFYDSGALLFSARSFPSLHEEMMVSLEDQLAAHPYYIVTRPGGCTFCLKADISYSSEIPEAELRRLTSFRLSCLTSFRPCTWLEDVLPMTRDWHLYSYPWAPAIDEAGNASSKRGGCRVPVWALGRDAYHAWLVDVLSSRHMEEEDETGAYEIDEVRLVSVSRGASPWKPGDKLIVHLVLHNLETDSIKNAQSMNAGGRYILLPEYQDSDASPVSIRHCGVLKDEPAVVQALQDGFSRQDVYRGPFLSYSSRIILTILAAFPSEREPPKTVKS